MNPSSRDRLSVDMRGLKAALFERADALGVSPSKWVRKTVVAALGPLGDLPAAPIEPRQLRRADARVRLHLRMDRADLRLVLLGAQRARLSPADYLAGLAARVPVLSGGGGLAEQAAALRLSCAELSTLSRNVHLLSALLRQADSESAKAYRRMLDTLAADVRKHLEIAAAVLAGMRPARGSKSAATEGGA